MHKSQNEIETDLKNRGAIPRRATLHFATGEHSPVGLDDEYQAPDDRVLKFGNVLSELARAEEASIDSEFDVRL